MVWFLLQLGSMRILFIHVHGLVIPASDDKKFHFYPLGNCFCEGILVQTFFSVLRQVTRGRPILRFPSKVSIANSSLGYLNRLLACLVGVTYSLILDNLYDDHCPL